MGYDFLDDEANVCAVEIVNPLLEAGFSAHFLYGKNSAWDVLNLGRVGINVLVKDPSRPPRQTLGIVNSFADAGFPPMTVLKTPNEIKLDDETIRHLVREKAIAFRCKSPQQYDHQPTTPRYPVTVL